MDSEPPFVRRVVIRGRVQAVGYRAWTEDTALINGVDGWVRNRVDGTVEAVFMGPRTKVEAMIDACRRGPPSARVEKLEIFEGGSDDLALRRPGEGFSTLQTT
ncbi:MAG: acylphosphatase [Xanthobacteraceae bacterium]